MSLDERLAAAQRYKPESVRLLLVAEAPPCAGDRYFYFDRVESQDSLFRYVWQAISGEPVGDRSNKPAQLARLRDAGVFLIDLHEENIAKPKLKDLVPCVPGLADRAAALAPEHIVLIKASVYDAAFSALRAAGLPVIDERLPFPGSGQQRKFLDGFERVMQQITLQPV